MQNLRPAAATSGSGQLPTGTMKVLGTWQSGLANNTVYQAASDGFVVSWGSNCYVQAFTDSSNPPTTVVLESEGNQLNAGRCNMTFPVRKGNYWKVFYTTASNLFIRWIPLGS